MGDTINIDSRPYTPTPEEQMVLDDCRQNATERGAMYGVGSVAIAYPMLNRSAGGRLKMAHHAIAALTGIARSSARPQQLLKSHTPGAEHRTH